MDADILSTKKKLAEAQKLHRAELNSGRPTWTKVAELEDSISNWEAGLEKLEKMKAIYFPAE